MRVQQVGEVNFGHKVVFDIGASDRQRGSCKISLLTDAGVELDSFEGKVSLKPFERDTDFTEALTERLVSFELKNKEKIDALKGKDRELSGVIGFAPGATVDNRAGIITNLVKTNDQSLQNVDYNTVPAGLRKALDRLSISVAKDLKFIATNDMIGTGAALAKQLGKNGALRNGQHAAFYMAGGGLGTGEIETIGGRTIVKSVERGHTPMAAPGKKLITAELTGASSTTLIREFAKASGFGNYADSLVATGNGKIATQFTIVTDNPKEIEALNATGCFSSQGVFEGKTHLRLNGLSQKDHLKASRKAINAFVNTMATLSARSAVDGVNQVILTGPLTAGVAKDIEHNPKLFGGKSLLDLIKQRTMSLLNAQGQTMAKINGLEIVQLPLPNNTKGGYTALKGKFTSAERGNWLEIPRWMLQRAKGAAKQATKQI
jgi:hypothetical protein